MASHRPGEKLTAASPCSARWSEMKGGHKVRCCSLCGLEVRKRSAIKEAAKRLYLRADGTVLAEDCPIGLRAARLRLARLAGMMTALLAEAGAGFWIRLLGGVFSRS